ncbi:asparagine synthase B [Dongshaea marina]|uniref:asparagine synthase B n=1 Tax=Dongshaea marina TaxID=2047966 RepID=UPI000D3E8BC2|nr:asparagine synthase B [Dongshaea marina]
MCSIFAILDLSIDADKLRKRALDMSKRLRHRGPDWSGIYCSDEAILAHERLAIVDVENGAQPLYSPDHDQVLAVNGEIYNHRHLESQLTKNYPFQTQSDCEVILALYREQGEQCVERLSGIFAFVLYDAVNQSYLIARDHMGIIPLYTGYDEYGHLCIASEMKALTPICETISEFPPGHYLTPAHEHPVRYYHPDWQSYDRVEKAPGCVPHLLRESLEQAVRSQLMSDVPYGVLLSGGLDSSIIAAIAKKYSERRIEEDEKVAAWWPRLHSFAIGLEGAPDLKAARQVADHIGTVHHELHFSIQEGLDALSDVIYHLETFDVTTIRASTPMYLMARKIRAMGVKMVLSGEGADEIFGGYLYFHKAPDAKEFHEETVRKLSQLHLYDCLRANKSMASWGVEARVPFLDKQFIDTAMSLNPQDKMCGNGRIEKQLLREAFSQYLPESVLWRQKEQFSDGVGYGWINALKEHAEEIVSDKMLQMAGTRFPFHPPKSKEAYLYREIFTQHFPHATAAACVPYADSVACSTETALKWDESFKNNPDPSGRAACGIHEKSYS